ncbi:hypothetical protein [Pedobacter sp. Leaf132]|uniref:hypothetical protein n=1 Tax=Pedobacter sp. Leaf132 TaxID=2876557 RepID=UPI001E410051|nr:hypothetical protein [Pedobacter sp. Leaf132]
MATAYWKLETDDAYTSQVFTIQLESFKTTLQPLNTENIIGREIEITKATWFPKLVFAISWELLPLGKISIEEVNKFLNENSLNVNLDDFDELPSVFIEKGKEGEYGNL